MSIPIKFHYEKYKIQLNIQFVIRTRIRPQLRYTIYWLLNILIHKRVLFLLGWFIDIDHNFQQLFIRYHDYQTYWGGGIGLFPYCEQKL